MRDALRQARGQGEKGLVSNAELMACFVAVAELRSFTHAAAKMGVSQPQVTLRIRKLEEQVGFALFSRNTRPVELTLEAERFLPYARDVIRSCEAAQAFLAAQEADRETRLRLGSPEITHNARIRDLLLHGYLDRNPAVRLHVQAAPSTVLLPKLAAGELDAVLTYMLAVKGRVAPSPGWQDVIPLVRCYPHVVTPKDHALAGLPAVTPEDLSGHRIVLSPGAECPAVIEGIRTCLALFGVPIVNAPETRRATVHHLARSRGLLSFDWAPRGDPLLTQPADMKVLPFSGGLFHLLLCLITRRADRTPPIRKLRTLSREVSVVGEELAAAS